MFAFMNTLSVSHIYNVLSHKREILFSDSKTASPNMFGKRYKSVHFTHLSLHTSVWMYNIYINSIVFDSDWDPWLDLAFKSLVNIECIARFWQNNPPNTHTHTQIEAELNRTQPKPLMQFSFNHELMKLFAIVLFFLNNSTLWCTSEWTGFSHCFNSISLANNIYEKPIRVLICHSRAYALWI